FPNARIPLHCLIPFFACTISKNLPFEQAGTFLTERSSIKGKKKGLPLEQTESLKSTGSPNRFRSALMEKRGPHGSPAFLILMEAGE
ncbi:MAG: hypothetical protein KGJ09_09550, partial [Candidatus Omnitrophica bacterium]|nr:hypothetical protein [Candidatus Omnitrophota bacterium]